MRGFCVKPKKIRNFAHIVKRYGLIGSFLLQKIPFVQFFRG